MELLNVIEIQDEAVVTISSYDTEVKGNEEKAEKLFKKIAKIIDNTLTDDELDDAVMNGYVESNNRHHSVCLTWSTLIK
jgi:hypothetical protein